MSNRSRDKRAFCEKEFRVPCGRGKRFTSIRREAWPNNDDFVAHKHAAGDVRAGNPIIDSATRSRAWKTPAKNSVSRDNLRLPRVLGGPGPRRCPLNRHNAAFTASISSSRRLGALVSRTISGIFGFASDATGAGDIVESHRMGFLRIYSIKWF